MERRRIAILGGGPAAISAAWALTHPENPEASRNDVTIYTIGWRLGGKGACGRLPDGRILEHGLHVWGGFYENAFRMMRDLYATMNRPPDAPLSSCFPDPSNPSRSSAYTPVNEAYFREEIQGQDRNWTIDFSEYAGSDRLPGTDDAVVKPLDYYIVEALDLLTKQVEAAMKDVHAPEFLVLPIEAFDALLSQIENEVAKSTPGANPAASHPHGLLQLAKHLASIILPRGVFQEDSARAHDLLIELLDQAKALLGDALRPVLDDQDDLRHLWFFADIALTLIRGVLRDNVLAEGVGVIEDRDFADWMTEHGLSDYSRQSVTIKGFYDYLFAYRNGNPSKPVLSAGSGLLHFVRMFMTYNQAIFWKMSSGMGDAVFAPAYDVLRARGVKFQFFSDVRQLRPSADRTSIAEIEIGVQLRLAEGRTEYAPLIADSGGLSCWPSDPLFAQLNAEDVRRFQAGNFSLEAPSPDWQPSAMQTLELGRDFDEAILAITLEPLRTICAPLAAGSDAAAKQWSRILQSGQTVATLAGQIWLDGTWPELHGSPATAVGTHFPQQQSSWLDMSQVLDREGWGPNGPRSLIYLCGYMPDDTGQWSQPRQDAATDAAAANTKAWLPSSMHLALPAMDAGTSFRWDLLHDDSGASGPARFQAQYWRANISGPERYVLTLPGGNAFRPFQARTGLAHLYAAGDWCFTGLAGCVEGAVVSGLQAARAISGYPNLIVGEVDQRGAYVEAGRPAAV
jgi:uncharacterized protein with NAD-binding domain and iron-sulfur cluster